MESPSAATAGFVSREQLDKATTALDVARSQLRVMLDAALDVLPPRARLLERQIRWSARGLMGQIKSLPVDFGS